VRGVQFEEGGAVVVRDDLPEPEPERDQEVVDVRAAALNFMEVLIRRGAYPQPPPLPWVPGAEIAGEHDGRAWIGLVRGSGGGFAERVAIDRDWLFPLPEGGAWSEGASFLMPFLTAWLPLTRQVSLRAGTRVLVTAAAGGVGSAAVQVVRALGADVCAAVGSDRKREVPRSLGADPVVTYDRLEELGRVDVVFDPVGGELFGKTLGLLKPLGTAIAIGFAGGAWQPLDVARLVGRNSGVAGFYLGRMMQLEPETVRVAAADVLRLWEQHVVHPVVGAKFPLLQAEAALDFMEERQSTGKVVLIP
jgi:NADPH2:quinone reductase